MKQSRRQESNVRGLVVLVSMITAVGACGTRALPPGPITPKPAEASSGVIRPGDRVVMYVEGERALSDTFIVRSTGAIDLPALGAVTVAGVPRSGVQSHLNMQLARYLKKPILRAHALVRVGVLGEVARPGFYTVPPEAGVADALASAGGPTKDARVDGMHVDRDGRTVTAVDKVQRALASGTTLDQLGITSGDQFVVPPRKDPDRMLRLIGVFATIPAAILAIVALNR
jgi:protein involved in polysaccharide export with SLBB domain